MRRSFIANMISPTAFFCSAAVAAACVTTTAPAQEPAPASNATSTPRARDLGIPFDGTPGPLNAITDVVGVLVGQCTLIEGEGAQAVRTGVTAIMPNATMKSRRAAFYRLNGDGEMTGTHFVEERGQLISPVVLTNTISVPDAAGALIRWTVAHPKINAVNLPVVGETWDGYLNDIYGFHVRQEHVFAALDAASGGAVEEGNVGGGTGMICHGFKGGIGTASRVVARRAGGYTLGVLVQANHGRRRDLRIAGIPVAEGIAAELAAAKTDTSGDVRPDEDDGSIIVIVATDAPLMPFQLKRIVRRVPLGLARNGSHSSTHSGDLFLAFTTAPVNSSGRVTQSAEYVQDSKIDALFEATVQATEEAIINALVAAETMVGKDGHRIERMPHEALRTVLKAHARLE